MLGFTRENSGKFREVLLVQHENSDTSRHLAPAARNLGKVAGEGSNLFARSKISNHLILS
jgi:hypothetical protein